MWGSGGVCSVTVTIIGNGLGAMSSNPEQGCWNFIWH